MELAGDQWWPVVETEAEEDLQGPTEGEHGDSPPSENISIYLNKNRGAFEEEINDYGEISQISEEEIEEEVVEVEFEQAIPMLNTHSMHCPNCDAHITKVVLRRKISKKTPQVIEKSHEPVDLLSCLSCFSLFIAAGNCLSMFRAFWKGRSDVKTEDPPHTQPEHDNPAPTGKDESHKPDYGFNTGDFSLSREDEALIDVPSEPHSEQEVRPNRGECDSTNFEILKSIVYGGLMEIIASLSVVVSAVASDATTLNIIALALADLVGGILIISQNVWDLRNDCYKRGLNQESRNKYKDLLGTVNHFPFHLIIVTLSFVAFGVVPPVAYGLSFRQTHDKDFTMLMVAIASLLCVGLLAIFKAYVTRSQGFLAYLRIVVYYVTTVVSVSGLSYVVGHYVMSFIEECGLLQCHSTLTSTRATGSWHHTDLVRGLGNDLFSSL